MTTIEAPLGRHYETSLDRAGLALGVGGAVGGTLTLLLLITGGQYGMLALLLGWGIGAVFSAIGILTIAGPAWLILHSAKRRGPLAAAMTGFATAMLLFVAGQTHGFGLVAGPVIDGRTLLYRWISAVATGVLIAVAAAAIGLTMWRIAYRRVL